MLLWARSKRDQEEWAKAFRDLKPKMQSLDAASGLVKKTSNNAFVTAIYKWLKPECVGLYAPPKSEGYDELEQALTRYAQQHDITDPETCSI